MTLRLRPPRSADEAQALAADAELGPEGFAFLLERGAGGSWGEYLARLEQVRRGEELGPGRVPATFLFAEADGELVGRVSIRHELNDFLERVGGHIGFGVRPQFRRQGHATEILRQGLIVARSLGIDAVLVTCDEDNVGSIHTIERCGGMLEDTLNPGDGAPPKRRYWIT